MSANLKAQTFALATPTVTVELSTVDALGVGLSLRALARQRSIEPATAAIYARVGEQLQAAARRAMTERK